MVAGLTAEEHTAPWTYYDRVAGRHIVRSGTGIFYSQFIGIDSALKLQRGTFQWPGLSKIETKAENAKVMFFRDGKCVKELKFNPDVVLISPHAVLKALCVFQEHPNFKEMRFLVAPDAQDYGAA